MYIYISRSFFLIDVAERVRRGRALAVNKGMIALLYMPFVLASTITKILTQILLATPKFPEICSPWPFHQHAYPLCHDIETFYLQPLADDEIIRTKFQ